MNRKQNLTIICITVFITVAACVASIKQIEKRKAVETELSSLKSLLDNVQMESEIIEKEIYNTNLVSELNAEIDQLKKILNDSKKELVIYQNQAMVSQNISTNETTNRESYAERMNRLKEDDPEEYNRIISERRERQQATQYSLAQRTAMFMEMDTSYMNEDELENHQDFINALASVFELSQNFNNPEDQPSRRQMREIWQQVREAQPIVEQQRKTIFMNTFRQELNMNNQEAESFYNNLEHIFDVTSIAPRP